MYFVYKKFHFCFLGTKARVSYIQKYMKFIQNMNYNVNILIFENKTKWTWPKSFFFLIKER